MVVYVLWVPVVWDRTVISIADEYMMFPLMDGWISLLLWSILEVVIATLLQLLSEYDRVRDLLLHSEYRLSG